MQTPSRSMFPAPPRRGSCRRLRGSRRVTHAHVPSSPPPLPLGEACPALDAGGWGEGQKAKPITAKPEQAKPHSKPFRHSRACRGNLAPSPHLTKRRWRPSPSLPQPSHEMPPPTFSPSLRTRCLRPLSPPALARDASLPLSPPASRGEMPQAEGGSPSPKARA